MPVVHKKTFIFLVNFMKNLLKHSELNGLDPKIIGESGLPMVHAVRVGLN